ncbi:lysozyme C-1-like [Rana temporaria]|uniref:lysozyme C-1-like n=1 Tax=Rana temporaria TaxID=8407 RepID=UPI001AAD33F8|nr:lysozyme C-1-like [Rana temporaria]
MVTNVQTPLQKEENRCVILRMVKKLKLAGHAKISADSWMCLFRHSSNYNSKLKKKFKNGHGFGLCQLNSGQHCKDGKAPSKNVCKISCSKFLNDDFNDDIRCLKKIVKSVKDLNAWPGWNNRCKGKNHKQYIEGCKP